MDNDNDFQIDDIDSIVAINILLNTYKIDVMQWTREELENIQKLLTIALTHRDIK